MPTVIKGQRGEPAGQQVGRLGLKSFQLNDVLHEARQMVAAARQEAARQVQEARSQAESIRQTARREGHDAGFAEGRREGMEAGRKEAFEAARKEFAAQQASLVTACRQIVDQINAQRADWWAAARQDLIDLAVAIARRVIVSVGQRERQAIEANLEEAVRLVGKRSEIAIEVNPADAEAARAFAQELIDRQTHWKQVSVVENAEVSAGGCRVQWDIGAVDATLETQLDRIARELGGQ
jgi:flagellar assembly protein FliH